MFLIQPAFRRVANRLRPVSGRVPLQPARLGYRRSVPGTGGDLASVGAGGPCRGDGCGVDRAGNSENSKSYSAGRGGNNPEKRLAPAPESKKPLSRDMTVTALPGYLGYPETRTVPRSLHVPSLLSLEMRQPVRPVRIPRFRYCLPRRSAPRWEWHTRRLYPGQQAFYRKNLR